MKQRYASLSMINSNSFIQKFAKSFFFYKFMNGGINFVYFIFCTEVIIFVSQLTRIMVISKLIIKIRTARISLQNLKLSLLRKLITN